MKIEIDGDDIGMFALWSAIAAVAAVVLFGIHSCTDLERAKYAHDLTSAKAIIEGTRP